MAGWRLSASNIGWAPENDETVLTALRAAGFAGLEIAPTRLFPENPYDHMAEAAAFRAQLQSEWGLTVPSMQSIWYGVRGSIFDAAAHPALLAYTEKAYAFANAVGCKSLVYGCPKNRTLPAGQERDEALLKTGEDFFAKAGALARRYGVRLAIEANDRSYTNYLNTTAEVLALLRRLNEPGLAVNLDMAAVLAAGERVEDFAADLRWVSHVHISEPGLAPIRPRPEHARLAAVLRENGYPGFVSIEMGRADPAAVQTAAAYVSEVFA